MQKISDPPTTQCPKCQENSVIRLVSAAGFQLKGTGWYATDFKNKPKSETKKEEKPKDTSTDSGSKTTEQKSSDTAKTATTTSTKGDKE